MSVTTHPSDRADVAALLVAAGRGLRAGIDRPKQYLRLVSETILGMSIRAMAADPRVNRILCVIHPDDQKLYDEVITELDEQTRLRLLPPAYGGLTRQASGHAGLEALAKLAPSPQLVIVHDAARPFSSLALVRRGIEAAFRYGAAIPGVAVTDTIKQIDPSGHVVDTPPRRDLRAVQTPQAFRFDLLIDAHRRAASLLNLDFTDDAAIAEWAGHNVHVFEGDIDNLKITTPDDIVTAQQRLIGFLENRVGFGYDVHAFAPGDHVMLGGIEIPFSRKLAGHSDADVALHALTDAVLGALSSGDIGAHFPPSDPRWKDASSDQFLAFAAERVRHRGGRISHLDLTIICEAPKIGPVRDAMRHRIAAIAGISVERVGVKATTTEQLGFTGRGEGIAAHAVATLLLPPVD
jgi:2-C-methyl-D-erythritol 4-phosphate cytidylyltransferase/2-C-methyl-D-erythritol 2,4-cyclodiphosphate synthase